MTRPVLPNKSFFRTGAGESIILIGTQLFLLIAGLINQAQLAWLLGPEGRGAFAVCFLFASLTALFATFSTEDGIWHSLVSRRFELPTALGAAVLLIFVGSAIAATASFVLFEIRPDYMNNATESQFHLAAIIIPLVILVALFRFIFLGGRLYIDLAFMSFTQVFAIVAVTALLCGVLDYGIEGALIARGAGDGFFFLIGILRLHHRNLLKLSRPQWLHVKGLLSFGARYFPTRLTEFMNLQISLVILGFISDQFVIGIFAAILILADRSLILSEALNRVVSTRLSNEPANDMMKLATSLRVGFYGTLAVLVAVASIGGEIISVFLSAKFQDGAVLLWALIPAISGKSISLALAPYFRVQDRLELLSITGILCVAVNGFFCWWLYLEIGSLGTALALGVGIWSRALYLGWIYCRDNGITYVQLLCPTRHDVDLFVGYINAAIASKR